MTIRELIFKGINWLIDHPKVLTAPLAPITRKKVKAKYVAENTPLDFDADLRAYMQAQDAYYIGFGATTLQSMIDEAVPENEDIGSHIGVNQGGS